MKTPPRSAASHNLFKAYSSPARWSGSSAEEEGPNHQVVSFKSPADTPAMPGMLRKSTAFVPRYHKKMLWGGRREMATSSLWI